MTLRIIFRQLLCPIALASALEQVASRVAARHPDLRKEILLTIAVEDELGFPLYLTGAIGPGEASAHIHTSFCVLDQQLIGR